jgi:hypothetical protein
MVFSVYFFNERHDARAERLMLVELRLEQKIQVDDFKANRQRLWDLREECSYGNCTEREKKELRELESEVDIQKEKIKKLQERDLGK